MHNYVYTYETVLGTMCSLKCIPSCRLIDWLCLSAELPVSMATRDSSHCH